MDDNKTEKSRELSPTASKGVIIVKRGSNGQLVLYDTERQEKNKSEGKGCSKTGNADVEKRDRKGYKTDSQADRKESSDD